jgi:putative transposase
MKTLRRYSIDNAYYFITAVTYQRQQLLLLDAGLFRNCWHETKPRAWVVLPNHFHAIIVPGETDISTVMHRFKITYSRRFRQKFRPGRVWQNRFWDHVIRDQQDLNRHLDYIHYNPVKHGLTDDPFAYVHSSLNAYYEAGVYERDWGVKHGIDFDGEYGE